MKTVSCCPVCGEETPTEASSNATNTGRFVKEPEFAKVFPCFLRVFEVTDPPWFEKAFVFCSECCRQLTVVSELEEVMKEVERRLKESEKVVQDKLKSSESKFQSSGVYGRDQRYWKVRGEFLSRGKSDGMQGKVPEPVSSTVAALFTSPEKQPEYVSVEVDPSIAEDFLDESEVAGTSYPSTSSGIQPDNPVPRPKRYRAPPKRFNPDEIYTSKKKRRNEPSIETGRRASTIPQDVEQIVKVEADEPLLEEEEEVELYQILEEMDPEQMENVSALPSTFASDPLAFAQQLDGGVVEHIKVEVNPEDDRPTLPQNPKDKSLPRILRKRTPRASISDFNFDNGVLNVQPSQREDDTLPTYHKVRTLPRVLSKPTLRNVQLSTSQGEDDGPDELQYHSTLLTKLTDGSSGYHCCKCKAKLPSLEAAKTHVKKEHSPRSTLHRRCVICDEDFETKSQLGAHILEVHQSQENYDKLVAEKAKEQASLWLTPGKPEVIHHGIRLFKVGDGKQYQCSACDAIIPIRNPFQERNAANYHVVQNHTDLYKCEECGKNFPSQRHLTNHSDRVHKGIPTPKPALNYTCPVCLKPLVSPEGIKTHMWSHYNKEERMAAIKRGEKRPPPMKKPFQCDQCVKKFVKELELQRHKNFAHNPLTHRQEIQKVDESTFLFHSVTLSKVFGGETEKYKCSACELILETMNAAKSHVISVHTRFYKCDLCERRFPYPAGLQKHLESTHKQGSTSYCPTCKKPFVGKKPSSNHLWTHYSEEEKQEALARGEKVPHTIVKRYQCEQCASSFTCESAMRKHQQRAHEGVPQEKKICGVCGAAVVSLLAHMKQSHPKEEDFRFSCSVCNKKFAQYTRLKHHKKVYHGIGDMLKCDLCPKEYAIKKDLDAHRNMHLNIRPFKCPKCPMAFTRAQVLRKHKLYKHEGVKCPPSRPRKKQKVVEVETSDSE